MTKKFFTVVDLIEVLKKLPQDLPVGSYMPDESFELIDADYVQILEGEAGGPDYHDGSQWTVHKGRWVRV